MAAEVRADEFLERLRRTREDIAARWGGGEAGRLAVATLGRLERCLSRPLRVVVLGEPNSGKTSLVNRLIGADLFVTDVIQNTRSPVVVAHGDAAGIAVRRPDGTRIAVAAGDVPIDKQRTDLIEVRLPRPILERLELVDTPGLVALDDVPESWRRALWRADIVVWCTIATQAWRATELGLWSDLGRRAEASLLVTTRGDLLPAGDAEKVRQRLEKVAGPHFAGVVVVEGGSAEAAAALGAELLRLAAELASARSRKAARIVGRLLGRIAGEGPR